MSRTHVHTKLRFVVPPEDVEKHQTSFYTIMNWKHFYNKFYGRYRGEKPYRKMDAYTKHTIAWIWIVAAICIAFLWFPYFFLK